MNYINRKIFPLCIRILTDHLPDLNSTVVRNYNFSRKIVRKLKPSQLFPNKPRKWEGGKEYYGFTYYPRYPDQEDPHWKESPLFLVERRKQYKGLPFWEKRILRNLRIEQDNNQCAIVINSEQMNKTLWKIKHLVTITPITFPDGIPEEKDIPNCHLHKNGELRIQSSVNIERLKATEEFQKSIDRIDKETIQNYTRKLWLNGFVDHSKY